MLGPLISVLCVLAVFPATCEIPPVLPLPPPLTPPLNSSVLRQPPLHISTPGPPDDEEWVPVMVPYPRRRPSAVLAQVLGLRKGIDVVWYILYIAIIWIGIHWGGQHENEQAETGGLNNQGNMMNEQASDVKSNKKSRKSKNRNVRETSEQNSGLTIGKLRVSHREIGRGSNGTIVLEGTFHGCPVAVKRVLMEYHQVASKEQTILMESDHHPNIVRWFGEETDTEFVYVVLERCRCSLNQAIPRAISSVPLPGFEIVNVNNRPTKEVLKVMRDIVAGVAYLHKLGIVHRDLKPQNVLIHNDISIGAKVSDMGISKHLPADTSPLINATGSGSSGWQAPEQLCKEPETCAVDLFSLGCLLFFCITDGQHPFGDVDDRRANIENGKKDLFLLNDIPEAEDLISRLLNPNPSSRPTAAEVYNHPLFWDPEMLLSFIRETSYFVNGNGPKNKALAQALQQTSHNVVQGKWNRQLDYMFFKEMNSNRQYTTTSLTELLRFIRDALNHYDQLSIRARAALGPLPTGFEYYFRRRFPNLLITVYNTVQDHCSTEAYLAKYHKPGPF